MATSLSKFWLLISCAALAVSTSTSARDLPPLAPQVDIDTLTALVTLAARDRICAQAAQREFFALDAYRKCMADRQELRLCDVSRSDLVQLRDLMASDSRLTAIASFEAVVAYIASSCAAAAFDAYDDSMQQAAPPAQCTMQTPLLTAHAIALRIPAPSTDERIEQRATCASTLGKLYLSEHCQHWARPRGRPLEVLRQQRPKYLDYFCPLQRQH